MKIESIKIYPILMPFSMEFSHGLRERTTAGASPAVETPAHIFAANSIDLVGKKSVFLVNIYKISWNGLLFHDLLFYSFYIEATRDPSQ